MLRLQASWQVREPAGGDDLLLSTTATGRTLRIRGDRNRLRGLFAVLRDGVQEADLAALLADWPAAPAATAARIVRLLREQGVVLADAAPLRGDDQRHERYDRQIRFFEGSEDAWRSGTDLNDRLQAARVVVPGLGGGGVWLVTMLHRMGVHVVGVDDDLVEPANLHRQFLYEPQHVGRPKALVCAEVLARAGGAGRFTPVVARLTDVVACADVVAGSDLVLNQFGYDLPSDEGEHATAFHVIARGCERAGVPSLTFGNQWYGPLRVPGTDGACAGCLVHHEPFADRLRHQARAILRRPAPSIIARTGFDASVAIWEAVKYLARLDSALYSTALVVDTIGYRHLGLTALTASPHCEVCRAYRR